MTDFKWMGTAHADSPGIAGEQFRQAQQLGTLLNLEEVVRHHSERLNQIERKMIDIEEYLDSLQIQFNILKNWIDYMGRNK